MALINIRDKTLDKHFKGDYGTVWDAVNDALHLQTATLGETSAKWLVGRTYDQIRHRVFYGNVNSLVNRYRAKLAADWAYIHRKEELHKKLFKKLELDRAKDTKPITLKTTEDYEHGTSRDFLNNKSNQRKIDNRVETIGSTTVDALETPNFPTDMIAGDFGDLPKAD